MRPPFRQHLYPTLILSACSILVVTGFSAESEKTTRLQVWLDRQNFGPGKIDGKGGEFTSKAAEHYRSTHDKTGVDDEALVADFKEETLVEYQIQEADTAKVGTNAEKREDQSKQKLMPYASLLEAIAERYHSDIDYLRELNPGTDLEKLKPGDTIKVPNVLPFEIESIKEGLVKSRPEFEKRSIKISAKDRLLTVVEADKVLALFPITPGSEELPAPPGTWKVEKIVTLPPFRWDLKMLNEGERGTDAVDLPPGPRNPAGILWVQLNKKGIGIHGTEDPESIGRSASHGCIRLANWDAAKLAGMITDGIPVVIE